MAEIGALCRERGIYFGVDAAQTAGVIPIDVAAMRIDVLAFTGHKSLLGPTGIGGLYVGRRRRHPQHPLRRHRGEVGGALPPRRVPLPARGRHPEPRSASPDCTSPRTGSREHDLEAIYRHEMELFATLQEGLAAIDGVRSVGTTSLEHRLPVLSFTLDGMDPADIGTILDVDFNIATRTGLQCAPLIHEQLGTAPRGTVRASVGPFNTREHVRAIAAVTDADRRDVPAARYGGLAADRTSTSAS